MLRLLHIADVHLGASFSAFGALAGARRAAVLDAFRRLPEAAAAEGAHAVVVAGDLFDSPRPPADAAAAARETVRRLLEDGRPVFLVPGNHDPVTLHPDPYRDMPDGAHVFRAPTFEAPVTAETAGGPLHVYGLAYDRARAPDPLPTFARAARSGVHVVLLHGSVEGAPHWTTSPNALRLTADALGWLHADYIALGDYHRHRPPAAFSSPAGVLPACYSGSYAALDLTEAGPRGYVIADLAPGQPPIVAHRPSGVAPVFDTGDIDVGGLASDAEVADAVAARVAQTGVVPVGRLVGTPGYPLHPPTVTEFLTARFGHAGLRDDSRYYGSARLDELGDADTVVGHVVRLGRRRIEEARADAERDAAERALRIALHALGVH
jgi:DNA repair protein SbcD/Mre11